MGTRRIYNGANFGAANLGRNERLISAGIVAVGTLTVDSPIVTNVTIATGTPAVGQTITGAGIPNGTTISGVGVGTLTLSANATASQPAASLVSNSRVGLVGEYLFGRDINTSKVNLTGGTPLTFLGSPVFTPRSVSLDYTRWAETSLFDTQDVTLLAICGTATGNNAWYITNFNGVNGAGTTNFDLQGGSFRSLVGAADATSASGTALLGRTPLPEFTVKVMRTIGLANFTIKVDEFRSGVRMGGSALTTTKTRKLNTNETFAIGSKRGVADGNGANVQMAGAAIWTRALSDAELAVEVAAITAKMAAWPQQSIAA